MGDRLVIIRTVDLGDKQASYLEIPKETNPLMGNRGFGLAGIGKNLFKNADTRLLHRASWYGNLGMMYPRSMGKRKWLKSKCWWQR